MDEIASLYLGSPLGPRAEQPRTLIMASSRTLRRRRSRQRKRKQIAAWNALSPAERERILASRGRTSDIVDAMKHAFAPNLAEMFSSSNDLHSFVNRTMVSGRSNAPSIITSRKS